jgi:hypothetical protein
MSSSVSHLWNPFNIPPKLQLKKDTVSARKPYHKTYKYGESKERKSAPESPNCFQPPGIHRT